MRYIAYQYKYIGNYIGTSFTLETPIQILSYFHYNGEKKQTRFFERILAV
jgi:hypothetical protein